MHLLAQKYFFFSTLQCTHSVSIEKSFRSRPPLFIPSWMTLAAQGEGSLRALSLFSHVNKAIYSPNCDICIFQICIQSSKVDAGERLSVLSDTRFTWNKWTDAFYYVAPGRISRSIWVLSRECCEKVEGPPTWQWNSGDDVTMSPTKLFFTVALWLPTTSPMSLLFCRNKNHVYEEDKSQIRTCCQLTCPLETNETPCML